jgi:hypothetical protein
MEEYKSFFDYESLENYLSNKNVDLLIKNHNYLSQEAIKNLKENLPIDYIICLIFIS